MIVALRLWIASVLLLWIANLVPKGAEELDSLSVLAEEWKEISLRKMEEIRQRRCRRG